MRQRRLWVKGEKRNEGKGQMKAREAVRTRILDLCSRRSISEYMLIYLTGMPPSTIKSIINGRSGNPGIQTIQRIAEGLGITLREFYDSELFEDLEPEE